MKWFNNLNIKLKLLSGFSAVSLLAAIMGFIAMDQMSVLNEKDTVLYEKMTLPLGQLARISTSFQKIRVAVRDIALNNTDNQLIQTQTETIKKNSDEIVRNFKLYEGTFIDKEDEENYNKLVSFDNEYNSQINTYIDLIRQNKLAEANAELNGTMAKAAGDFQTQIEKMIKSNEDAAKNTNLDNIDIYHMIRNVLLGIILIVIILGVVIGRYISKYISNSVSLVVDRLGSLENICLNNLERGTKLMADGNLDFSIETGTKEIEVKSKDEIGVLSNSLNHIIRKTQSTVSSVENAKSIIRDLTVESGQLVNAAIEGDLSKRGNAAKFNGVYKELIEGLNSTFTAVATPINDSGEVLSILAKGDLTARMKGSYKGDYSKVKDNINSLAESFSGALSEVNEAIQATASAASEISSSSEQMAAGSQEQSNQTSEVASAVEEMTKTILESTQNASKAAENSRHASQSAQEGQKKVEDTKAGMQKIVQFTNTTGEKIASLAKKTEQIGEITQVIDDIADQTNLLALNAAIEAARAGEQGRGFAVVADEVRKLAERTTKATKEIAETIKQIQNEALEADKSMNDASNSVEEGMSLTEAVSFSLNEILEMNQKVSDMISQVAAASEEESSAAEQISKNIEGISSVTQQSAAGTQQIANAAEDLNRLTVNLQDMIGKFKLQNSRQVSAQNRNLQQVSNSRMRLNSY